MYTTIGVYTRLGVAFWCSISKWTTVAAFLQMPTLVDCGQAVLLGLLTAVPILVLQTVVSMLIESFELSRGASLAGVLNPYSELQEIPLVAGAGYVLFYRIFFESGFLEKNIARLGASQTIIPSAATDLHALSQSIITMVSAGCITWIPTLLLLAGIELYWGAISKITGNLPLADVSFLIKLGLGGVVTWGFFNG